MDKKQEVNQSVIEESSLFSSAEGLPAVRPELLETLSAMMDDEAESLEVRRVVKALDSTPELNAHWRRYHAVRASLRQDLHSRPEVDLLAGVKARLAAEQEPVRFRPARWSGKVLRVAGQGLVAASVAAAVLFAYPALQGTASHSATPAVATSQTAVQSPQGALPQLSGDYNASPLTRTVSLDDAARHRLEKAVRNFSGTSAVLNTNTNMPMFATQLEPFTPAKAPADQAEQHK